MPHDQAPTGTSLAPTDSPTLDRTVEAIISRARSDAALIRRDAIAAAQRIVGEAHANAANIQREAEIRAELHVKNARRINARATGGGGGSVTSIGSVTSVGSVTSHESVTAPLLRPVSSDAVSSDVVSSHAVLGSGGPQLPDAPASNDINPTSKDGLAFLRGQQRNAVGVDHRQQPLNSSLSSLHSDDQSAGDAATTASPSKSFANLWSNSEDDVNIEAFLSVELDRKETRRFLGR